MGPERRYGRRRRYRKTGHTSVTGSKTVGAGEAGAGAGAEQNARTHERNSTPHTAEKAAGRGNGAAAIHPSPHTHHPAGSGARTGPDGVGFAFPFLFLSGLDARLSRGDQGGSVPYFLRAVGWVGYVVPHRISDCREIEKTKKEPINYLIYSPLLFKKESQLEWREMDMVK